MPLTAQTEGVQQVKLDLPGGKESLYIINGYANFTFTGGGGDWTRDTLSFSVGPSIPSSQFVEGTVVCFLSRVMSTSGSQVGWSVDNATVTPSDDGPVTVTTDIAVYATSNQKLARIAFQVMVRALLSGRSSFVLRQSIVPLPQKPVLGLEECQYHLR